MRQIRLLLRAEGRNRRFNVVKNVRQVYDIDYYLSSTLTSLTLNMTLIALALAAAAGSVYIRACHRCRPALVQCGVVVILVLYLVLVFVSTVFGQRPGRAYRYELTLFWSYREIMAGRTKLIAESFWNVMMLLPVGALPPTACAKMKLLSVTAAAFAVSLIIELTQLITKRSLFEFDDTFHSTLGAIMGYGVYQLIRTLHNITD